jgi:ubiquinone/menaquinone biosynthesis C-methylase UbiE
MKAHHLCPWWLAYTFDNPLRRFIHRPEVMFSGLVQKGMTVMDIGCGMGYFSIALAGIVGPQGLVIAVDLQRQMLDVLRKRADRAGVGDRIRLHQCEASSLGVETRVDFALAFWVVHETPDAHALFGQIASLLKPGGKLLIAEPKLHVTAEDFQEILTAAGKAGLRVESRPPVALSRAALFSAGMSG